MKQFATGRTEAVRLPGEVERPGDRIKQMLTVTLTGVAAGIRPIAIPANLYRWVLVKNNSGRRLLFFRDRGGSLNSLLGIVEPHTTDTLPVEGNLSEVFVQWAEISLPGETFLYFLAENPGLVGNFIQNIPEPPPLINPNRRLFNTPLAVGGFLTTTDRRIIRSMYLVNTGATAARVTLSHRIAGVDRRLLENVEIGINTTLALGFIVLEAGDRFEVNALTGTVTAHVYGEGS